MKGRKKEYFKHFDKGKNLARVIEKKKTNISLWTHTLQGELKKQKQNKLHQDYANYDQCRNDVLSLQQFAKFQGQHIVLC